jgi:hypothetical protein
MKGGETSTASNSTVIDAFVHPDINAERGGRLIRRGKDVNAGSLPAKYDGAIEGVSLAIDYVEFDDGTELGPDNASFRRKVAEIRSGAAKYRRWLAQQFGRRGEDVNALTPLLEMEPSPEETGAENENEAQGASLYKNYAIKVKEEKGARALAERLKQPAAPAGMR